MKRYKIARKTKYKRHWIESVKSENIYKIQGVEHHFTRKQFDHDFVYFFR